MERKREEVGRNWSEKEKREGEILVKTEEGRRREESVE